MTTQDVQAIGYSRYYGLCESSGHPPLTIVVEAHPDGGPDAKVPDQARWDGFGLTCPVCSDTVPGGYEGADDLTSDRQRTLDLRNGFARGLSQAALAAEDRAVPQRSDNTADQRLLGDALRRLAEHLRVEAGRVAKEAGQ